MGRECTSLVSVLGWGLRGPSDVKTDVKTACKVNVSNFHCQSPSWMRSLRHGRAELSDPAGKYYIWSESEVQRNISLPISLVSVQNISHNVLLNTTSRIWLEFSQTRNILASTKLVESLPYSIPLALILWRWYSFSFSTYCLCCWDKIETISADSCCFKLCGNILYHCASVQNDTKMY